MPIYEYECQDCERSFEVFLRVNDTPVKKCEYCQGKNIRKLVSNCSFQLKGTGWYVTDYANKDNNNGGNGKKKQSSDTTSSEKASESKETGKTAESSSSSSESKSSEKSSGKAA